MILVTGGTGFIGSHTCVALANAGQRFLILDNLQNSRRDVLDRLERLCGARSTFIEGDVRDSALLDRVFAQHEVRAVIHFAALKAVGESIAQPLGYYQNNLAGTLALLQAMQRAAVNTLVFSSSATVYGDPASVPTAKTLRSAPPTPTAGPSSWSSRCWPTWRGPSRTGALRGCVTSTRWARTKAG